MQRFNHRMCTPTRQGIRSGVHRFSPKPPAPCDGLLMAPAGAASSIKFTPTMAVAYIVIISMWEAMGEATAEVTLNGEVITPYHNRPPTVELRAGALMLRLRDLVPGTEYTVGTTWSRAALNTRYHILDASEDSSEALAYAEPLNGYGAAYSPIRTDSGTVYSIGLITGESITTLRPNVPSTLSSLCTSLADGGSHGMCIAPWVPKGFYGWRWNSSPDDETRINVLMTFNDGIHHRPNTTGVLA